MLMFSEDNEGDGEATYGLTCDNDTCNNYLGMFPYKVGLLCVALQTGWVLTKDKHYCSEKCYMEHKLQGDGKLTISKDHE